MSYWNSDRASLLHPTYGDSARDIRGAIGAGPATKLQGLARQVDQIKRTMVNDLRDFRGFYVEGEDWRVTPDHNKFIGIQCPDGTVTVTPVEGDPHMLEICGRAVECADVRDCVDCDYLESLDCICDSGVFQVRGDDIAGIAQACPLEDGCENTIALFGGRCLSSTCQSIPGGVGWQLENQMTISSCGLCVDFDDDECNYSVDLRIENFSTGPGGTPNVPDGDGLVWAKICTCGGAAYWIKVRRSIGEDCCN